MEFNDREKAIVIVTSFLANKLTAQVPRETLAFSLSLMLKTKSIEFTVDYIQDLIDAIQAEQSLTLQQGFAFLDKHKQDGFS